VDFRKWFQPRDQKDPNTTRKGIVLNLDQWVRMRKLYKAINNDYPVLATALPCYMSIHIAFNFGAGSTSERIEIFPATVFHADGHPMTTGSVRGVGIADEETRTIG